MLTLFKGRVLKACTDLLLAHSWGLAISKGPRTQIIGFEGPKTNNIIVLGT